jgi:hypothetical protein
MNLHLCNALNLYESKDIDLQSLIGWHLCHGIVVCNSEVFALGFHCYSSNPEKAVALEESDTLYVTICCGDMASGLKPFKDKYKYIAFRRDFKGSECGRLLSMKKFYSKLQ